MLYQIIAALTAALLAAAAFAQDGSANAPDQPAAAAESATGAGEPAAAEEEPAAACPEQTRAENHDGPDGVALELNKLEPVDGACRAFLVIRNATPARFETLQLDLVMFDTDGIVAKRLAVDAAPLPAEKTLLKVFDIKGQSCGQIGQILLNGVLACRDSEGQRDDCLKMLSVTSRGEVLFIK